MFPLCRWPATLVLQKPSSFDITALSFSRSSVLSSAVQLLSKGLEGCRGGFAGPGLEVVYVCSTHTSLAGAQTNDHRKTGKFELWTQREKELIFVKDTAICLYHNFLKYLLTFWVLQLTTMLPMLITSFSADFGIKLLCFI